MSTEPSTPLIHPTAADDHVWKIEMLRQMVRIRRFEHATIRNYTTEKMGTWLLLSIGQEMVAAGVRSVMGPYDHTITGPRGTGHALIAGMTMRECMAEYFGKATGCSKGKGGSFSFYAPHLRHWGCYALAAAQTPVAAGLAFALKQREVPGAVVCFLGDGAVNQGVYHESLNLAGLFDLPVVYVIENNQYALGTSVARSSRFKGCLARRAETYDIEWDLLTDQNPDHLRARMTIALERARNERRPTVVEIETYRYYGFSISDANHKKYRTPQEIEAHKELDPIRLWKERLISEGAITKDDCLAIDEEMKAEAQDAAAFAENSPPPEIDDILKDVYWEVDNGRPADAPGRLFFD